MEVHESARKHGIVDADIAHAVTHHLYAAEVGDGPPWRVLYLGPDRSANLLEVVTIERDDDPRSRFTPMKMRTRYERVLPREGRENDG